MARFPRSIMANYNKTDILVSPSGDLSLGQNGDFAHAYASGVLKQDISFRVRTNKGECYLHPNLGADLEELIGEPNTELSARIGENKISRSLTNDDMVSYSDLYVHGMPTSTDSVVYYVFVNTGEGQVNVTPDVLFSSNNGVINAPGYLLRNPGLTFISTENSFIITQEDGTYIA